MTWKNSFSALLVGVLFAIGLSVAGMTQPQKILGFLDVFGAWDPSLMFAMVGAIGLHAAYIFLLKPKFKQPVLAVAYQIPVKNQLTASLFLGSALFGIGWALGGYCPGPAIVSLAKLSLSPVLFVASMLAGMAIYRAIQHKLPFGR